MVPSTPAKNDREYNTLVADSCKALSEIRDISPNETNVAARKGRPHYRGEGGDTPTRGSYALRQAVRLLCGFAGQLDKTSSAGVVACLVELTPGEIDLSGQTTQLWPFEYQHGSAGTYGRPVAESKATLGQVLDFDLMGWTRRSLFVEWLDRALNYLSTAIVWSCV